MSSTQTGNAAEQAVARHLEQLGYKIIELNWKIKIAEIDIVATKHKTMYFVEVKYRSTDFAGDGFDYITYAKLKHMQRAAEAWVQENAWRGEYAMLAAAVTKGSVEYVIDLCEVA